MKLFVLLLFAAVVWASSASGNSVPDWSKCTVVPADQLKGGILCPDSPTPIPESVETITVRDSDNRPWQNAMVRFDFGPGIVTCPHAVLVGATNSQGVVRLTMAGGGCNMLSGA